MTHPFVSSVAGVSGMYRLRIPASYDKTKPAGIVYAFAGWGNSASSNERYMGLNGVRYTTSDTIKPLLVTEVLHSSINDALTMQR